MASRLPLRSYRQILRFLRLTLTIRRQLAASEGMVGYSLLAQVPDATHPEHRRLPSQRCIYLI